MATHIAYHAHWVESGDGPLEGHESGHSPYTDYDQGIPRIGRTNCVSVIYYWMGVFSPPNGLLTIRRYKSFTNKEFF